MFEGVKIVGYKNKYLGNKKIADSEMVLIIQFPSDNKL